MVGVNLVFGSTFGRVSVTESQAVLEEVSVAPTQDEELMILNMSRRRRDMMKRKELSALVT